MNLEHVERINSIEKLEKEGFEGWDASLEVSLLDYGIIWKALDDGEVLFVYRISDYPEGTMRFDRCKENAREMFLSMDWAYRHSPEEYENSQNMGWIRGIANLHCLFGFEEIFGSSYWEGFEISGLEQA